MATKLYSSSDARVNKRLRQLVEAKRTTKETIPQAVDKNIQSDKEESNIFIINQSNRLSHRDWQQFLSIPTKAIWKNTY